MAKEQVSYSLTAYRISKILEKDKDGTFAHLEPFKETGIEFKGEYDFGDAETAAEMFGAQTVYSFFHTGATLRVGELVRSKLAAGKTKEEIQEWLDAYKLEAQKRVAGGKKGSRASYLAGLKKLSPEEREAELQRLLEELESMPDDAPEEQDTDVSQVEGLTG